MCGTCAWRLPSSRRDCSARGPYVARGVTGSAHVSAARKQAVADLATSLPASQRQSLAHRGRVRASRLAALRTAEYSWREVVCALRTQDVAFTVEACVQEREIRSVDLIPAPDAAPGDCDHLFFSDAVAATGRGVLGVTRGRTVVPTSKQHLSRMCPRR